MAASSTSLFRQTLLNVLDHVIQSNRLHFSSGKMKGFWLHFFCYIIVMDTVATQTPANFVIYLMAVIVIEQGRTCDKLVQIFKFNSSNEFSRLRLSPLPLPQWLLMSNDCTLHKKSMLVNLPPYEK